MSDLMTQHNPSSDLLSDTLMMEDFAPDIDLLDDILGLDYDWKDIEPSLVNNNHNHPHHHSHHHQNNNGHGFVVEPSTILLPSQGQGGLSNNSWKQEPISPPPNHTINLKIPNFAEVAQNGGHQQQHQKVPSQPQRILPAPPPAQQLFPLPPATTSQQLLIPTTSHNPGNLFSTCTTTPTTGGIPQTTTAAVFASNAGTIILPQLQLVAVNNNGGGNVGGGAMSMSNGGGGGGGGEGDDRNKKKKKESTNRRSSHNAIERRYRSSINDKILELKSLVCTTSTPNEKVHKAAILRSSIDTIRYLQNANNRMEKENRNLKGVLTSARKCTSCGADQQPLLLSNPENLRELLQDTSPPPTATSTSASSGDSNDESSQDSKGSTGSPLALFGVAAGLFLINPGHHHAGHTHHEQEASASTYHPRIFAFFINLLIFLVFCYVSRKLFRKDQRRLRGMKTAGEYVDLETELRTALLKAPNKKQALEKLLGDAGHPVPSRCRLSLSLANLKSLVTLPFGCSEDVGLSKVYVELGKVDEKLRFYCGMKALKYGCSRTRDGRNQVVNAVLLSESKMALKYAIFKHKGNHVLLDGGDGLAFLKQNLKKGLGDLGDHEEGEEILSSSSSSLALTTCLNPNDPTSVLLNKYKGDLMSEGVRRLYHHGDEGADCFKKALRIVLDETKDGNGRERDRNCEWWACMLWANQMGRQNSALLQRLHRIIDMKQAEMTPLATAFYHVHMATKREQNPSTIRRLLSSASSLLRDSITLTTHKPSGTLQLLWTSCVEAILEARVDLWEEEYAKNKRKTDGEFTKEFSRDLDTLRGLSHYVKASLPSVYLYEASLRLMTKASPSRTQQLLDYSLLRSAAQARSNRLICSDNGEKGTGSGGDCKRRNGHNDRNLIREKRKAMALYLRCKHLPYNLTIPGEKAGMLREALKCLEVLGGGGCDVGRIAGECREMMIASTAGGSSY